MKKYLFIALGAGLFSLASCNNAKRDLIGKWQIEEFETPAMDSAADAQLKSIDTIKQIDSMMAQMLGLKTQNLDTFKSALRTRMTQMKEQQEEQKKTSSILSSVSFTKDGLAIFHTGDRSDTSKFSIVKGKTLVLAPFSKKQIEAGAQSDTLTITDISKSKLRLKARQGDQTMYIRMHPFTKDDSVKMVKANEDYQRMMQQQMQQLQQMQQQQGGANVPPPTNGAPVQ